MAEDRSMVRNKGMLAVAFVLAVLVVVLYNVQVRRVAEEARGTVVKVLVFRRSMKAGDEIDAKKDLEIKEIPRQVREPLGSVVDIKTPEDVSAMNGYILNQDVSKGAFLQWGHVLQDRDKGPSGGIRSGFVGYSLQVDARAVPGDMLRVGDYVNLVGRISLQGRPLQSYRIVERIRVLAIGGRGVKEAVLTGKGRARKADQGQRSFRSITVELLPAESLILDNVVSHVVGDVRIEVLRPDSRADSKAGSINDKLRALTASSPKMMRRTGT